MQLSISWFTTARDEVSANSAGGAPFLLCCSVTYTLTAMPAG